MTKKSDEFYFEIRFWVNKVEVKYLNIITADSEEMIKNLITRFIKAVKKSGGKIVNIEDEIINKINEPRLRNEERIWRRLVDACRRDTPNEFITVEEIVVDKESETQTVNSHRLPVYLRANFEDREYFSFEIQIITQLSLGELEFKVVLPA